MIRDTKGSRSYWDQSVDVELDFAKQAETGLTRPAGDPNYRPQFARELARTHLHLMLRKFSRGDPVDSLKAHWSPLLDAWETSERLGESVWTPEMKANRQDWRVNFDFYIESFWVVGLALCLDVDDAQWARLLVLVGNEGNDVLLDRIIAVRTPARSIGQQLCFRAPYQRLLTVIDTSPADRPAALREFVEHWHSDLADIGNSGLRPQATDATRPYWHGFGDQNFEGGDYFGRWCIEAVAATKAFRLDDTLCIGHPHYPAALLHPEAADEPRPEAGWLQRVWNRLC